MVTTKKKLASSWLLGVCLLLLAIGPVQAAPISWDLTYEFSGAAQPSGVPNVTITDITGGVTLKMTAPNSGTEKIGAWYFNVDQSLSSSNFSVLSSSGTFATPTLAFCFNCTSGSGALKADGDGYFDFAFNFNTSSGNEFDGNDMLTYTILAGGLSASSFNLPSLPGGGNGSYTTAAHVQGIAAGQFDKDGKPTTSGWVGPAAVPAPTSLLLFGTGLIGLVGIARREMLARFFKG